MAYGPTPTTINWDEFDKLVSYQCTQEEIASFFNCSVDTLDRACQRDRGERLADVWLKKRALGRVRLRKAQMQIVERGGPGAATMAIYLDKKMFPTERPDLPPIVPPSPAAEALKDVQVKSFPQFCLDAGYPMPYPLQIEMMQFGIFGTTSPVTTFDDGVKVARLLLGARGYGKTDYITILGAAYYIYLMGTAAEVLIISKSKVRNTAIIEEIAVALEKNGVALEKSNASCVRVAGKQGKDHSAEALTIKSSFRGRHPKLILMDDPVTEEDVSEAMRLLVKRKYNEAFKLCSNICVIGQPAHAYDLYAELRDLVKKLELPHGSIPELDHDLEAQRLAGVDESSIQASYFLKVPTEGQMIFANLKFVDTFPLGDSSGAVAFIDPSEGGDNTAVSVIKGYMDGVAVQGDQWKRAWYHCLDDITSLFKALGVKKVCFETNKTGDNPLIQLRELWGPMGIGVVGKHSDSNKHAIIQSAGSYADRIFLSRRSGRLYTDHVVKYEYGAKFDDAPDSLARGLEWIGLLRGKR